MESDINFHAQPLGKPTARSPWPKTYPFVSLVDQKNKGVRSARLIEPMSFTVTKRQWFLSGQLASNRAECEFEPRDATNQLAPITSQPFPTHPISYM